jgi:U3 small nucleolar RNA-associated protein 14
MNRKLENLLQAQLEEPSHEFDAIEELSFQDYSSDAYMNGDNLEDEDVSMQDDN